MGPTHWGMVASMKEMWDEPCQILDFGSDFPKNPLEVIERKLAVDSDCSGTLPMCFLDTDTKHSVVLQETAHI